MTKKKIQQLINLLKELKSSNLLPPNMPFDVWKELMTIVPAPAAEVLITRNGKDFLLTERHDKFWDGWHIPGGFLIAKEKIEEACNRLAKKELGISVNFQYILSTYTWPDHPYANAISLICVCHPKGKPITGKYFTKIPDNTIKTHKQFLKFYLNKQSN